MRNDFVKASFRSIIYLDPLKVENYEDKNTKMKFSLTSLKSMNIIVELTH
jgi:hypothetical protein